VETWRYSGNHFDEPRSYSFYATLSISYTMAKETGKYTCVGIQDSEASSSSVDLLVPGEFILLNDLSVCQICYHVHQICFQEI